MEILNRNQINEKLKSLKDWQYGEESIIKNFTFKDFKEALAFMVKTGAVAEELNHHPNWSNTYNKVNIKLSTHDAGGVTEKDFELAERIEFMLKTS